MGEEPQKGISKEIILYKNYVALSSEYTESDGEDSKIFEEFYNEVEQKWLPHRKQILLKYVNFITP